VKTLVWRDFHNSPVIHRGSIDNYCRSRHYGCSPHFPRLEAGMAELIRRIWSEDQGQDIAEYAVMLAVILVLVVGTIRLIGTNANNVFSSAASAIQ